MKLATIGSLIAIIGISHVVNASAPTYSITDLGLATSVEGFGNNNQVLAIDPSGDLVLFNSNGTLTDLTILIDDSVSLCFGPTYNRAVWGVSDNNGTQLLLNVQHNRGDCAMIYKNGQLTNYDTYVEGAAVGINDSGQVIGNNQPGIGTGPADCNFASTPFGWVTAQLINDAGQIVGNVTGSNTLVLCTKGTWTMLQSLPGASYSYPVAINKHGIIVGTATVGAHSHGFYISPAGITSDMGTDIQITDINIVRQSVGSHTAPPLNSFMRVAGATYDLVTVISATDPLQPYVTFADPSVRINDNGVIAAIGTDSRTGASHVYLLKPM